MAPTTAHAAPRFAQAQRRRVLALGALLLAAPVAVALGVAVGPIRVGLPDLLGALAVAAGLADASPASHLVLGVRLPRALVALVVGVALAVAGAVMQALFGNPLAEPGITGVSAGAATGAVAAIVFGAVAVGPWVLPLTAFVGAVLAVVTVQLIGLRGPHGDPGTLLLVGIALNSFLGAVVAALMANAPHADDVRRVMFWLNGDLTGATMADVTLAVGPVVAGVLALLWFSRDLNLLTLGDAVAHSSGVHLRRTRTIVLLLGALVTASAVSVSGIIAFVGLVVPHMVRLVLGDDHRVVLPASALAGGVFLVLADIAARVVSHPVVLQTGTITALVGAPVLLALVLRRGRMAAR